MRMVLFVDIRGSSSASCSAASPRSYGLLVVLATGLEPPPVPVVSIPLLLVVLLVPPIPLVAVVLISVAVLPVPLVLRVIVVDAPVLVAALAVLLLLELVSAWVSPLRALDDLSVWLASLGCGLLFRQVALDDLAAQAALVVGIVRVVEVGVGVLALQEARRA